MDDYSQMSDLDLAALVSSKICHDALGPMTAVGFGLDVLDEDEDEEQREGAVAMISKGVGAITAKLQFARLAYGAAGSVGADISLQEAQSMARNYVETDNKHKVEWTSTLATLPKNHVKLLLNLIAVSVGTIPRGGTIAVSVDGTSDHPNIFVRTSGPKARVPAGLIELVNGTPVEGVDARSIQPFFAGRIARTIGADVTIKMAGDDALFEAKC